MVLLSRF